MKGKDLTQKAFSEFGVGTLTWAPRSSSLEGAKRGVVIAKGSKSLLVNEHYYNYMNDSVIEKKIYLFDQNGRKIDSDMYERVSESFHPEDYKVLAKELKGVGVKFKR